jgi:hypothetical protein
MFWKRKQSTTTIEKLPKPKSIPPQIGSHMIVDMKIEPNSVWDLRAAFRPREENKDLLDFRLFNWQQTFQKDITIHDYNSLDEHPEYILYEGWWNKKGNEKFVKARG